LLHAQSISSYRNFVVSASGSRKNRIELCKQLEESQDLRKLYQGQLGNKRGHQESVQSFIPGFRIKPVMMRGIIIFHCAAKGHGD